MQSETADNIAWAKFAPATTSDRASTSSSGPSELGIEFRELATPIPLHAAIREVNLYHEKRVRRARVLVVCGRSRRLAVESHEGELKDLVSEYGGVGSEVRKTMGDVASAFVVAGAGSGLVVVQAAMNNDT